jgi:hypothetical protein
MKIIIMTLFPLRDGYGVVCVGFRLGGRAVWRFVLRIGGVGPGKYERPKQPAEQKRGPATNADGVRIAVTAVEGDTPWQHGQNAKSGTQDYHHQQEKNESRYIIKTHELIPLLTIRKRKIRLLLLR